MCTYLHECSKSCIITLCLAFQHAAFPPVPNCAPWRLDRGRQVRRHLSIRSASPPRTECGPNCDTLEQYATDATLLMYNVTNAPFGEFAQHCADRTWESFKVGNVETDPSNFTWHGAVEFAPLRRVALSSTNHTSSHVQTWNLLKSSEILWNRQKTLTYLS